MSDEARLRELLRLEATALGARTLAELRFSIVNETHALAPYRQAAVFELHGEQFSLCAASGLVSVAEDSPFAVWVTRFARQWPRDGAVHLLDYDEASTAQAPGWQEWLPEHLLLAPLSGRETGLVGVVLYAREEPWQAADAALVERLHRSYGYCYSVLRGGERDRWTDLKGWIALRRRWLLVAAIGCLLIPVRLSVLAPAEVVALDAVAVSAPQDGVVGAFAITPNTMVQAGDLLFSLDDTVLMNRRKVAQKGLDIAKADAHVAQQRAFDEVKSKGDLAAILGRVREKEAELAAVESQAERVEVRADRDGVAIFSDINDWLGRPVQTGERVMQLAQPSDAGVLVWLSVSDAINLEMGAPVRLFLHTEPLDPRAAHLIEASYQASLSPDGVAAYRLRARFETGTMLPRLGLRGTVRMSGQWVMLGYYLFRRPFATLREWTGL
ncbi:MAG: hypothetical protein RL211_2032 [Pseudomonadota bacterium]|jgi:hypothetical protein